jgi:hypothetical protein
MTAELRAGRIIGALTLLQMIGGFVLNFVADAPLSGAPGFLVNAAPHAGQIAAGVLLALVLSGMNVAIAVTAFPVFERHSAALARAFLALAAVGLALAVLEQVNVMSMVSVSEVYVKATAQEQAGFGPLRAAVAAHRNWAHYLGLFMNGCLLFVFYLTTLRYRLLPRLLAGFGVAAVAIQLVVVARPLFGVPVNFALLMPLALAQVLLLGWLLWKGFRAPAATLTAG